MANVLNAPQDESSVDDYIASLDDEQTVRDTRVLIEMQRVSGHRPNLWNVGTIGFDTYHYKYDTGREGDAVPMSFYPRKGKMTVYLLDGTARHSELLARLGKHTTSRVCLYINGLAISSYRSSSKSFETRTITSNRKMGTCIEPSNRVLDACRESSPAVTHQAHSRLLPGDGSVVANKGSTRAVGLDQRQPHDDFRALLDGVDLHSGSPQFLNGRLAFARAGELCCGESGRC